MLSTCFRQTCCEGKAGAPEFWTRQQRMYLLACMFVFSGMLAFQRPDLKFVCARSLARVLVFVCWCWNELAHLQKKLDVVFKLLLDMQGAGAQKNPVSFVPHIAEDMRRSQAQAPPQAHAPLLPSPSPLLPPLSDASPLPAAVHFDTRHASAENALAILLATMALSERQ